MILLPFNHNKDHFFENNEYPEVIKIVHNSNNPYWFYNYHSHKTHSELIFIAGGKGVYTLDNTPYSVEKGDLIVINRDTMHSILSDSVDPLDAYTCTITNFKMNDLEHNQILSDTASPLLSSKSYSTFITNIFEEIINQRKGQRIGYQQFCNMACATLVILTRQLSCETISPKKPNDYSFAQDVMLYISEHYSEPITLNHLSKVFHISEGHISHAISDEYHVSPINHLINCRITRSLWLLLSTKQTLTDISKSVGYDNANHFTKLFTKRMGIHPLEFREQYEAEFELQGQEIPE